MASLSQEIQDRVLELIGAGREDDATALLEGSLAETPDSQPGWAMLLSIRYTQNRIRMWGDAVARQMHRIQEPEHTLLPLVDDMLSRGFGDQAIPVAEAMLEQWPDSLAINEFLLYHKLTFGWDDAAAFAEYKRWNDLVKRLRPEPAMPPAATDPTPDRPLRIGYLSNDFAGGHSAASCLVPWFAPDIEEKSVRILYANQDHPNAPNAVFTDAADEFVDVAAFSDAELNERIRADRIDILVDFVLHMPGSRLGAFAMRPAPIIASWLGVGVAPGEESVDYVVGDEIAVTPAQRDNYVEKVVWLPETYTAWQPPPRSPEIAPPPCLASGHIAFGNLNRIIKFTPECLDLWAEVLSRVPRSTMIFKYTAIDQEQSKTHLAGPFLAKGIDPDRLIFLGPTPQFEHLETYNSIDIVLDSFPLQSGVSGFEPLWMGVPTVSYCCIDRPAGRFGLMFAKYSGLDSLAVSTPEAFVETAVGLAGDRDLLADLRGKLRPLLLDSPLCDHAAFARNVGAAFREMWRRYCAGEPPGHIALPNVAKAV